MSSIPEYILRNPALREDWEYEEVYLRPDEFDALFVPLDRQALRKQIRDIIEQDYSARPSSIEWIEAVRNEGLDETTDKIMRLFGLENTGDSK